MKNILLIFGGGGAEHEISRRSAVFFKEKIDSTKFNIIEVEIVDGSNWILNGKPCELNFKKEIVTKDQTFEISAAIPCIHGTPGETGDIQSFFEMVSLPYLGCNPEISKICFNKLMTKLWLQDSGLKTTPYLKLNNPNSLDEANAFLEEHGTIFVKSTNQGSSIGCYRCDSTEELQKYINAAFTLSPFVILEKEILGRELEISCFEYKDDIIITKPSEILCDASFYTYDEKYSSESNVKIDLEAQISNEQLKEIQRQAMIAFKSLKLRHLSRLDFFLSDDGQIYLNEVNTLPGHTEISMFPLMMENYGIKYSDFLNDHLMVLIRKG